MQPATQSNHSTHSRHRRCFRVFALALWLMTAAMGSLYSSSSPAADASNRQQAIDMALQQNGGDGKVLGVQTEKSSNGRTVFAVKVLSNGRVRVFRIKKAD